MSCRTISVKINSMKIGIMDKLKEQYKDKKILVVGLGLQGGGVSVVKFFSRLGAKVKVTDLKSRAVLAPSIERLKDYSVEYVLGEHRLSDFTECDVIFKGPSVKWDMPEILAAQKRGITVETEAAFFVKHTRAKTIGITGTRGKSTTSTLIYEILKKAGVSVFLAGNIPQSSTISLLETATEESIVVLELSSWQLSGFHKSKVSPHIAVLTNIYPDHLNYYKNMDDYFYDKSAIYLYQKPQDFFIVNSNLIKRIEQEKLKVTPIVFNENAFPVTLKYLKGQHNLENASAVKCVADLLKIDEKISLQLISDFKGLNYRQQNIGTIGKVTFINDTTSTTPTATIKAIASFNDKQIILVLGGNSKFLPSDKLIETLKDVHKIVLLKGSFTDEILPILQTSYSEKLSPVYEDLGSAIKAAYQLGRHYLKDCYLLFSPGATSFAMFNNEFHRGDLFNEIFTAIRQEYVKTTS